MATTKKTVKSEATDKKQTAASKQTATKKKTTTKSTTTKKARAETGVVDEFLNANMGGVVTMTEVSREPPQEIVTEHANTEVIDENYGDIEVIKPVEDGENNPDEEAVTDKWEELGLTVDLQADIQKAVSDMGEEEQDNESQNVVNPQQDNKDEDPVKEQTPNADKLQVNLDHKEEPQRFTYVDSFMGVQYD